ncbi:BadF/BadG/BcrA/BcrD ATPase family protein [Sporosarcina sp. Te-1]|uniref:BadF/BadG/BcrA/BcrD ATPase family protein n=1 Tax=Sporosarcina sp. Te-1 TaxID=2818390 RepID=UPI001A9E10F4|nr:BadF/BadG/BcrA/BcrD ATPase family protein [Sporosarcina sp. Te-1]QTD41040.1 hypothetical protein J3U78_20300 [Sporosarcina sp. Te-1]
MTLTIGIDAGGTKTTAFILDRERKILYETWRGEGNVAVNFEVSANSIVDALRECLSSHHGGQCSRIVAGVAGIEVEPNEQLLRTKISKLTDLPTFLINDALLSYYSVFGNSEGILTIAGTGSISIGMKAGDFYYTGGWGHLLGDDGSSFDIAIKAYKLLAYEWDIASTMSPFTKKLVEHVPIVDRLDLKRFIYNSSKGEIAALSSYIYQLANAGDKIALSLFDKAGKDLAIQTITLITKMGIEKNANLKIVGRGSLLEKNEYVYNSFNRKIGELFLNADIQISETPAALGAITFVENRLKI